MANSNGYVTRASTPPATPPDITDTIGLVCFSCLLLIFGDFDMSGRTRDWKVRVDDYRGMTFAQTIPESFASKRNALRRVKITLSSSPACCLVSNLVVSRYVIVITILGHDATEVCKT